MVIVILYNIVLVLNLVLLLVILNLIVIELGVERRNQFSQKATNQNT